MSSRNWCFTLNNPIEYEYPEEWQRENMKMVVYQLEKGENCTEHLQGYIELKTPRKLLWMKKLCGRAHWEVRRGSRKQAVSYVTKEESRLQEPRVYTGESWTLCSEELLNSLLNMKEPENSISSMKQRLLQIREKLSEGNSNMIEEIADEEFDIWVKHYRAFERYLVMKTKPRNHEVDVHVLQGPTGTGKSKWCMDNYPDAYWKQRSNWWDGYVGHETVIIDEFYGWLPFDLLLRICDRYPLLVETKGGQVQFTAKRIIITSNMLPSSWYRSVYFPAFARRVNHWHILPIWGNHQEFLTYEEFSSNAITNCIMPYCFIITDRSSFSPSSLYIYFRVTPTVNLATVESYCPNVNPGGDLASIYT